ncbi:hypothetical protein C8R47DRAFT_1279826 [Mycena vitilis]|nr:hypothetical protein C8R47DRAFT_1279826 [Mycena vitilis]
MVAVHLFLPFCPGFSPVLAAYHAQLVQRAVERRMNGTEAERVQLIAMGIIVRGSNVALSTLPYASLRLPTSGAAVSGVNLLNSPYLQTQVRKIPDGIECFLLTSNATASLENQVKDVKAAEGCWVYLRFCTVLKTSEVQEGSQTLPKAWYYPQGATLCRRISADLKSLDEPKCWLHQGRPILVGSLEQL